MLGRPAHLGIHIRPPLVVVPVPSELAQQLALASLWVRPVVKSLQRTAGASVTYAWASCMDGIVSRNILKADQKKWIGDDLPVQEVVPREVKGGGAVATGSAALHRRVWWQRPS
jgi:hypothetical protein